MDPSARIDRRPDRPRGPWKHGPIPVIGLIGEIGAGKSRVASLLAERGAFVLDADAVGHALLTQPPVRDEVVARFGASILGPSADPDAPAPIDRRALGAIVFADPAALRALEAILHPRMRRTFERAIARTARRGRSNAVILDAAILLETGWDGLCDRVVFVESPRDQRLARLEAQRGWTEEKLLARERAQWPPDRKRGRADAVVVNDSGLESLGAEVDRLRETILKPPDRPARVGIGLAASPPRAETRAGRETPVPTFTDTLPWFFPLFCPDGSMESDRPDATGNRDLTYR